MDSEEATGIARESLLGVGLELGLYFRIQIIFLNRLQLEINSVKEQLRTRMVGTQFWKEFEHYSRKGVMWKTDLFVKFLSSLSSVLVSCIEDFFIFWVLSSWFFACLWFLSFAGNCLPDPNRLKLCSWLFVVLLVIWPYLLGLLYYNSFQVMPTSVSISC